MQILKRYWRIIFPIIIGLVIWAFSSQTGDISDEQSLRFAEYFGISNLAARKFAHVILFSAFGYAVTSFVKGLHPNLFPTYSLVIYPMIAVTVYGAIDEVHQLTVAGRTALVGDVFIDTLAGICGILAYVAIFCFFRRLRIRIAYARANQ